MSSDTKDDRFCEIYEWTHETTSYQWAEKIQELENKLKEACGVIINLHGDQAFYVDVKTRDFIFNNSQLFGELKFIRNDEK